MTKYIISEEDASNIEIKIHEINSWLRNNHPHIMDEQNVYENIYWNYGYMTALKSVLSKLSPINDEAEASEIFRKLVQEAKDSYMNIVDSGISDSPPDRAKESQEQSEDAKTNLERRISSTYHWRWMPGMRLWFNSKSSGTPVYARMVTEKIILLEDSMQQVLIADIALDASPDLADPATLGATLQNVRDIFKDNTITMIHHGHGIELSSLNMLSNTTIYDRLTKHLSKFSYFSEMEALTCAMEFATELKNNNFID